jgi:hypothetical protein
MREDVCQRNSVQFVNLNTPLGVPAAAVLWYRMSLDVARIARHNLT